MRERHEAKTVRTFAGCWVWAGGRTNMGYGALRGVKGLVVYAHRVAYELARGPIPEGLTVDHLCRNRACQNVQHMELVTLAENTRRARAHEALMRAA